MARHLTTTAVVKWHDYLIYRYGGLLGVRDGGLLASAVAAPRAIAAYSTRSVPAQAAALCYSLVKNHAFFDGNKRTAFMSTVCFLSRRGYKLGALSDEWADVIVGVAEGAISRQDLKVLIQDTFKRKRQ